MINLPPAREEAVAIILAAIESGELKAHPDGRVNPLDFARWMEKKWPEEAPELIARLVEWIEAKKQIN